MTPMVKAIWRMAARSASSVPAASVPDGAGTGASAKRSTAWPATAPSRAPKGPPRAKPAAPPRIFPQIDMAAHLKPRAGASLPIATVLVLLPLIELRVDEEAEPEGLEDEEDQPGHAVEKAQAEHIAI